MVLSRSISKLSSRRNSAANFWQLRSPMLFRRYSPPIFRANFAFRSEILPCRMKA
jgi:hypothetical protein